MEVTIWGNLMGSFEEEIAGFAVLVVGATGADGGGPGVEVGAFLPADENSVGSVTDGKLQLELSVEDSRGNLRNIRSERVGHEEEFCEVVEAVSVGVEGKINDAIGGGLGGEVGGVGSRIWIYQFEGVAQAFGACGPRSIVAVGNFEDGRAKGIDKADIFATV